MFRLPKRPASLLILLTLPCLFGVALLRHGEGSRNGLSYEKREYRVPMRDGKHLFTAVYTPKDRSRPYPFLLIRTPYGVDPYGEERYPHRLGPHEGFDEDGFIFVQQDVRGRMMSEGKFVNMRPHITNKRPGDIDENTDTYDTIEWLLRNIPNHNGRVGIWGISYPGFYAAAGIIDSHPAIKAASPQAAIGDWFIGDDVHHHGALFLQDSFTFFSSLGLGRSGPTTSLPRRFEFGAEDAYEFFLKMGPLAEADRKHLKSKSPFWTKIMKHGTYDAFWQERNLIPHMRNVKAAVLSVAGFFDAEDPYGPIEIYRSLERQNPRIPNTIVLGPWIHGGWVRTDGDGLGNISFGDKTGRYFTEKIDLPFFKFHLKGEGSFQIPEALVFVSGSNRWHSFDSWPPQDCREVSVYLRAEQGLSFDPPPAAVDSEQAHDSYLSDPAKPVPYTSEIAITRSVEYMVEDQRFAARRPDVLVYQTEPLEDDLTLTGPLVADLFISTTGTDADFVAKLIDVYPNEEDSSERTYAGTRRFNVPMQGYQMLVRGEVMRAKFRNSYEAPEALAPGQVVELRFRMPDVAHTFRAGHSVMVQIQSSWFPLVDRNPQKFMDIYQASAEDFQAATHRVYRSASRPSRLILTVPSFSPLFGAN